MTVVDIGLHMLKSGLVVVDLFWFGRVFCLCVFLGFFVVVKLKFS